MLAGLLVSSSRSGMLGAAVGFVFFALCARRRLTAAQAVPVALGACLMLGFAAAFADVNVLASRLDSSFPEGFTGRFTIWQQTWPVIRDFWPLGSGVGTYQAVMIRYQTMSHFFYISHADNEFLQLLAEGGLLLALPVAVTLGSGVALVVSRMREDRTAIFWMRAGAAAGMLACATQNMVEMTLRIPANALLFAILAAVATHGDAGRHG
jgi:O-antigen ligase